MLVLRTCIIIAHGADKKCVIGASMIVGDRAVCAVGYRGTATAGNYGTIEIAYHDGNRYRRKLGYIGEEGLVPETKYKLSDAGLFVPVDQALAV